MGSSRASARPLSDKKGRPARATREAGMRKIGPRQLAVGAAETHALRHRGPRSCAIPTATGRPHVQLPDRARHPRPPHPLRCMLRPEGRQRSHDLLDERPEQPAQSGLAARRLPLPATRDAVRARRPRRGVPPVQRRRRPRLPRPPGRLGALVRPRSGRDTPPPGRSPTAASSLAAPSGTGAASFASSGSTLRASERCRPKGRNNAAPRLS